MSLHVNLRRMRIQMLHVDSQKISWNKQKIVVYETFYKSLNAYTSRCFTQIVCNYRSAPLLGATVTRIRKKPHAIPRWCILIQDKLILDIKSRNSNRIDPYSRDVHWIGENPMPEFMFLWYFPSLKVVLVKLLRSILKIIHHYLELRGHNSLTVNSMFMELC